MQLRCRADGAGLEVVAQAECVPDFVGDELDDELVKELLGVSLKRGPGRTGFHHMPTEGGLLNHPGGHVAIAGCMAITQSY